MSWSSSGCFLAASGLPPRCFLAACGCFLGWFCLPGLSWLRPGCFLAVSWLPPWLPLWLLPRWLPVSSENRARERYPAASWLPPRCFLAASGCFLVWSCLLGWSWLRPGCFLAVSWLPPWLLLWLLPRWLPVSGENRVRERYPAAKLQPLPLPGWRLARLPASSENRARERYPAAKLQPVALPGWRLLACFRGCS